ncbi:MFS transporter [Schleiferilactobacillus perolens]|uniref:Major facilitator superfamily permease n=1 Tax=Schleiferilactobacillus perolens DSM 12744 TaxID=1423792 RepID=A0A0R1MU93_9LACO|nr:MFS transporter [Schleiferilactobacillus perolens]KRL07899.1 major facilitator superfamily permease [Schleiferilactobacillus perolens DSM 12744]MCI2170473.1 MFS transporter [Schleiferilactobacillus perolens]
MQTRDRWIMLFATSMVSFMSTLDASVVNIAVPHISRELNVPMNEAEWVVSVYLVAICALLIFFGRLADQIGRIPVFQTGTVIFVLGSLTCGLSSSLPMLLAARLFQALGSSMVMATNFGIITQTFPINEHGRALGVNSTVVQIGNVAGPGIGGVILAVANWHWIFWINVPIGIIAFLFGHRIFPHESVTWSKVQVDWSGYLTFAAAVISFFVAIYWGQAVGFSTPGVIALFIFAAVLVAAFIWIEKRVATPLLQLGIFRSRGFTLGIISAMLVYMVGYFNNVVMPFYLQETLALSSATAGLILMAVPLLNMVSAPTGGIISDHIGAEKVSFYALFIFFVPLIIFVMVQPGWSIAVLIFGLAMFGVANGAFQNNPMIMDNAGPEYQGIAGSLAALGRNLGMAMGLSLATSLVYLGMSLRAGKHITAYPRSHPDWFVFAMHFSYWFAVALIVAAVILIGSLLRYQRRAVQANQSED